MLQLIDAGTLRIDEISDLFVELICAYCSSLAERGQYRNDYNSPEVVSRNKFSNWANLNIEETASNIAFGFIVCNEDGEKIDTFWFEGEEDQKPEVVYVLEPNEHVTLEITGKHGMSWLKACTLSYDCIVGFEVIPTEKLVKQEIIKETIEEIVNSEDKEVTLRCPCYRWVASARISQPTTGHHNLTAATYRPDRPPPCPFPAGGGQWR